MNRRPLARGIPGDILLPYYLAGNDYSLTRARQTSESSSDELLQSNSDTDLSSESSSMPESFGTQGNAITGSNVQDRGDQFIDKQIASQNGSSSDSEYFNFTNDDIHRDSSSSEEDSDSKNDMPMFDAQLVLEQAAEYWSDDEPTHVNTPQTIQSPSILYSSPIIIAPQPRIVSRSLIPSFTVPVTRDLSPIQEDMEEDKPLSDNTMEIKRDINNDEEEMQTEVSVNDDYMETESSEMSVDSDLTNTPEIPASSAIEISGEAVEPITEELETIKPTEIEEPGEDL
ncbi:hypothetical protein H4R99_008583, partial [Coemansia sp. RSA 1722]